MYLIDTNIFLELLLLRKGKDNCRKFLEEVESGRTKAILTDFSLHSILLIMEKFGKLGEMKSFLLIISGYKGLEIYHTTLEDEIGALEICAKFKLDFDDAIQFYAAKKNNAAIVSYDKDFDKTGIKRIEP